MADDHGAERTRRQNNMFKNIAEDLQWKAQEIHFSENTLLLSQLNIYQSFLQNYLTGLVFEKSGVLAMAELVDAQANTAQRLP